MNLEQRAVSALRLENASKIDEATGCDLLPLNAPAFG